MQALFTRTKLVSGLSFAVCLMASAALAAPATSEEIDGARDGRSLANGMPGSPTGAPVSIVPAVPQSKSVELLLQLQEQPQQAAADGRGAAGAIKRPAVAAPAATGAGGSAQPGPDESNPLATLKSAILRDAAPRRIDAGAGSSTQPANPDRPQPGNPPPGSSPRTDAGPGLLSNPVVQYIRENRTLILTLCAAVLAGIWLTATFSMRRNR